MITFVNTMRVLNEYGQKIQNLYRQKNLDAGYDPAAELQNITFSVQSSNGNFEIIFNMPDYWRWAENGRGPGKMPPPGVLMKWMEFKHILPSPMKLGNGKTVLPSMSSLEFLIRRKIGEQGTQGSHTWEAAENEIQDSLIKAVKEAINKDFNEYIKTISKGKK